MLRSIYRYFANLLLTKLSGPDIPKNACICSFFFFNENLLVAMFFMNCGVGALLL